MTKGEETRQKIIEQAAPLFNQLGYAGCSMQDIMAATGLEKGGLYRHFSSKEELAEEAFRYSVSRAMNLRWDGVDEVAGAVEKVQFMVRRFVEVRSTIPGGCPVMNTAIEADDGNPVLRKLAREALQQWKHKIGTIVEAGIERKEIRVDVEPRRIANNVIAALEGAQMISRLEGSSEAMLDAKSMLDAFLAGLRPAAKRG